MWLMDKLHKCGFPSYCISCFTDMKRKVNEEECFLLGLGSQGNSSKRSLSYPQKNLFSKTDVGKGWAVLQTIHLSVMVAPRFACYPALLHPTLIPIRAGSGSTGWRLHVISSCTIWLMGQCPATGEFSSEIWLQGRPGFPIAGSHISKWPFSSRLWIVLSSLVRSELLPQVNELKYLRVLFISEGKIKFTGGLVWQFLHRLSRLTLT